MSDRYPLYGSSTRQRGTSTTCQLCKERDETMQHFLFSCPKLTGARQPQLQQIIDIVQHLEKSEPGKATYHKDERFWSKVILDPSCLSMYDKGAVEAINDLTRNLCFQLHNKRSVLLTGNSAYSRITRKGSRKLA